MSDHEEPQPIVETTTVNQLTSHEEPQPIVEQLTSDVVEIDFSDISSFKSRMLDKAMTEDDFKNALKEAVKYIEYARTKYNFFKEELKKDNDMNSVNDAAKTLAVIMKCILLKVIYPWENKHFDKNAFYSAAWTGLKSVFKGNAVSEQREKVKNLLNETGPYGMFNKLKREIIELLNAHTHDDLGGYKFSELFDNYDYNKKDLDGIKLFNETGVGILSQQNNRSSGKGSSGTGMSMRVFGGLKKKRKSMKKGKKTLKSKKGGRKSRKHRKA